MGNVSTRMPAVFFGHGSPMNTLADNRHTQAWRDFGKRHPRPKAIVAISAHWFIQGTAVTAMAQPQTIHDFGGFPPALHAVQYPARGDPALARQISSMLAPVDVRLDDEWGLDHGTWSVLIHVFPNADVPVVQLALDRSQPPAFHYELGRRLAALRDDGVMIVGSGNLVHNLRVIRWSPDSAAYPWATEFNDQARALLERREHEPLVAYESMGEAARMSVPTPDHYLPMLYVMGAQRDDDTFSVLTDGIELGSISMLSFAVDHAPALSPSAST